MDKEFFTKSMRELDQLLNDEQWTTALATARQLHETLLDEPFPENDQMCWPIYSIARSLYALEKWSELVHFIKINSQILADTGPTNNAYAHLLAMEAAAHLGQFDDFLNWARLCLELRLIDQDVASMQRTLQASRELLKLKGRLDLLPAIIDHLYEIARDHHETELAELAREWAFETRDLIEQRVQ